MRKLLSLLGLALLCACSSGSVNPSAQAFARTGTSDKVQIDLVDAYHTGTQFLQHARCGKPFPFSDSQGHVDWTIPGGQELDLLQTGPSCFAPGQFDILAGPELQRYDCDFTVTQQPLGGYDFELAWEGVVANCSVQRISATEAKFILNETR